MTIPLLQLLTKSDEPIREIGEEQNDKLWYFKGEDTLASYSRKSDLEFEMKELLFTKADKVYYFKEANDIYVTVINKSEGEVPFIGKTEYDSLVSACLSLI